MSNKLTNGLLIFSIVIGGFSFFTLNNQIDELKAEIKAVQTKQTDVDYEKINEIVKNEIQSNSISNQTVNKIKSIVDSAEQTYILYSKEYVNKLIKSVNENQDVLRPDGSISKLAKEQMNAFLDEYNLDTYNQGVNQGVVKNVLSNNDKETVERIKKLMPDLTEQEIENYIQQFTTK